MAATAKKEQSTGGSLLELAVIVVVALGLALGIQAFLVKPYRIPSGSMIPTLVEGQRILVNRIGHNFSEPKVGDVVVFHPPVGAAEGLCNGSEPPTDRLCSTPGAREDKSNFVKRVVAGPGDTIAVRNGHVILNGKDQSAEEAKLDMRPCEGRQDCTFRGTVKVPADHYFMMGDNRGASDDSRFWGPVPNDWIIGGAFATYWPPKRIGTL
jgi:signal peptidase I